MISTLFKYFAIFLFAVCIICPSEGATALRRGDAGHVRTIRKPTPKAAVDRDRAIREHVKRTLVGRDASEMQNVANLLKRDKLDVGDLQTAALADLEDALIAFHFNVQATIRDIERMGDDLRREVLRA
ncbi:hypothetical protein PENSPDRAFT_646007 [Peniophora sp. CONT]|nr:hypothetical protein PENSPDRAFT_646007 [Peniophora sp. CONT]